MMTFNNPIIPGFIVGQGMVKLLSKDASSRQTQPLDRRENSLYHRDLYMLWHDQHAVYHATDGNTSCMCEKQQAAQSYSRLWKTPYLSKTNMITGQAEVRSRDDNLHL